MSVATINNLTTRYGSFDGDAIFVDSVASDFVYVVNGSAYTVDHIAVEATSVGGNTRWVRKEIPHAKFTAQTTWHIDFVNGNDENDGLLQGTALKTLREHRRRVGVRWEPPVGGADIYLYGSNDPNDPWRSEFYCPVHRIPNPAPAPQPTNYPLTQIRVHAMTPRVYYSGTLTGVTQPVRNYPNDTPWLLTDTNMLGANQTPPVAPPHDVDYWYNQTLDWNGNVRQGNHSEQRIRITGGPRAGAICWTVPGNLGSFNVPGSGANGIIRTSNPAIPVPFAYTANFAQVGVTDVIPQIGDPYVVEDLQLLFVDHIISRGNGDYNGSGIAFNGFRIRTIMGGDSQSPATQPVIVHDGGSVAFVACGFDFVTEIAAGASPNPDSFGYILNCDCVDSWIGVGPGFLYVESGACHLGIIASDGAVMPLDADTLVQTGIIMAQKGGQIWLTRAQVWDYPGHAIKAGVVAQYSGFVFFFTSGFYGAGRAWGSDQTNQRKYGIAAIDNGHLRFETAYTSSMISLSGVVKDISIGHSDDFGEKAVTLDPVSGAMSILLDLTYDNFFNKTLAQGGFGGPGDGHIIDLETGSKICHILSQT
jgi:hypothetical protein